MKKYRVSIKRIVAMWIINAISLLVLSWVLPGLTINNPITALTAAALIGILTALLWPTLVYITLPLSVLTLGLFTVVINAFIIWLAAEIDPEMHLANYGTPIAVAVGLAALNTALSSLFAIDDDESYYRNVMRRKLRRHLKPVESDVPGIIFLEIDGLAKAVLLRAIRNGAAPTMSRWLEEGSHQLIGWECDLSSQTGASQAGILLGNNYNIPAFRWYEKDTGRVMTSSQMSDITEIESRQTNGNGLLVNSGLSLSNMFSGEAPYCVFTMSNVREKSKFQKKSFYLFFIDPYNFLRSFMLAIWDIMLELRSEYRQRKRDIRPRLDHRGKSFPFVRAATTTITRELSTYTLIGHLFAGVPSAYVTLFGYDEVAHHSGVERADTLEVLRKIDQQFARLEAAARKAPRPYHFVILSDHGQSQGATFKQRYGLTLEDLVKRLIADRTSVKGTRSTDEDWSYLNAPLTEAVQEKKQLSARALRWAVKGRTRKGEVMLGPERENLTREKEDIADEATEAVVMASGNLGLVYFSGWRERMTLEQMNETFPGFLEGLAKHPGIGFIMVRSEEHGPVAISGEGRYYLADNRIEGKDPLAVFGPNTAAHLRRSDSFPNVADVMVISHYDPVTDEVPAFEELVGHHGGLGGDQSKPFVLFPSSFEIPGEAIVGAENLNRVMRGWLKQVQGDGKETTTWLENIK